MLIDSSHRRWIVFTTLAVAASGGLFWWLRSAALHPLTGGTTAGLWFGVATTLLMVYAGLLSAHRRLARWPLLPRRAWMLKGHIWLGLLSLWFLLLHTGFSFRWGWTVECLLWIIVALVIGSGLFGLVLQNVLPRLITERIAEETPYEQMPHVCRQMSRQAAQIAQGICGEAENGGDRATARGQLRAYYDKEIAPFLAGSADGASALKSTTHAHERFAQFLALPELAAERDRLIELKQLCDRRRQIGAQENLHHWLHVWLLVHIPLSAALLILGVVHIVMSLWY